MRRQYTKAVIWEHGYEQGREVPEKRPRYVAYYHREEIASQSRPLLLRARLAQTGGGVEKHQVTYSLSLAPLISSRSRSPSSVVFWASRLGPSGVYRVKKLVHRRVGTGFWFRSFDRARTSRWQQETTPRRIGCGGR